MIIFSIIFFGFLVVCGVLIYLIIKVHFNGTNFFRKTTCPDWILNPNTFCGVNRTSEHDAVISFYVKRSESFIEKHIDQAKGSWHTILRVQDLSEEFLRKYWHIHSSTKCWGYVAEYQTLSEDFIKDFLDQFKMYQILSYQNMSCEFIKKHILKHKGFQKGSWGYVSRYQKLSENFIREFADSIKWGNVVEYQNVSLEFLLEFEDKVDWKAVVVTRELPQEILDKFKENIMK